MLQFILVCFVTILICIFDHFAINHQKITGKSYIGLNSRPMSDIIVGNYSYKSSVGELFFFNYKILSRALSRCKLTYKTHLFSYDVPGGFPQT